METDDDIRHTRCGIVRCGDEEDPEVAKSFADGTVVMLFVRQRMGFRQWRLVGAVFTSRGIDDSRKGQERQDARDQIGTV